MESIGQKLKNIRQQKNLSLEDVQKETKIRLDILQALEEDRFDRLNPVYIKSFLKLYAQFLGEDDENIIKSINILKEIPKSSDLLRLKTIPAWKRFKLPKIKISKKTLLCIIIIIALFFLGLTIGKIIKTIRKSPQDLKTKESKEVVLKPSVTSKETKTTTTHKIQPIHLGIRAKNNCWLKVTIDGKTVFQGVLKKGLTESWQADKIIQLSLGDATLIELEINGKIISPLGRKGQAIKDIKITAEGITVGK